MASAMSRATRSSWPRAPTGSRTRRPPPRGRTRLRKPPNDTLERKDSRPSRASAKAEGREGPERTCILSRAAGAREDLIRLALSPDGDILPDVRAKAPGRGAWIGVDRATLEEAQRKGKLKAALARAFKAGDLRIPDDLGERIEVALRQA